jgi:uncharacterized protein (TIGR02302 family)
MSAEKSKIEISATRAMRVARTQKLLRRPLLLTRAGMLAERVTHAFWPLWSLGFLVWAGLSFRLSAGLPRDQLLILAGLVGLLGLGLLIRGLMRFRWPGLGEAALRLDKSLKDRPLSAMWDEQALGTADAASMALWRAHLERMKERAALARPVAPDLRLSARDPFALRYITLTAFVMALIFGAPLRDGAIDGLLPPDTGAAVAQGPVFEGWIEPPRYTGLPAIYLNEIADGTEMSLPQGSKVTIRLYGQTGDLTLRETLSGNPVPEEPEMQSQRDFVIAQSGVLAVDSAFGTGRHWSIDMIPDRAPVVALSGPADRSPKGEMRLPFEAQDDYGVTAGHVRITLDLGQVDRRYGLALEPEPVEPIVLDLPMPFNGETTDFAETVVEDLSKHPWAGLPVLAYLEASDVLDQTGVITSDSFALPGRRFFDPLAAAIVEERRDLLWNRDNARRVTQVLRAITHLPEDIFENQKAYLLTRSAIRRLEIYHDKGLSTEQRDEIAEMLWTAALQIEDGDLSDAEKRLKRAQERLSEAIKNGATDEELAELSEELRRAMRDYLEKLAREAEENPDQQQAQNGETREITSEQLQDMLDRIQELAREGRTEEAQELLEQLNQMMQNMQTAQRQQGQGQGEQAMRGLQDTLRQQQGLSDEAFRRLQEQFNGDRNQGRPGDPGQNGEAARPGSPGVPGGEGNNSENAERPDANNDRDLARRQEALRELLENQRRTLPDPGTPEGRSAREALERAEGNMEGAREALEQGDMSGALDQQADALDALRQGIEDLGQEMARNQSDAMGRQGDQAGRPDPNMMRDPLGRQAGTVGRLGSDESLLNGQDPNVRARELLDEIRRRSGDRTRPKPELDYLDRLLDRF